MGDASINKCKKSEPLCSFPFNPCSLWLNCIFCKNMRKEPSSNILQTCITDMNRNKREDESSEACFLLQTQPQNFFTHSKLPTYKWTSRWYITPTIISLKYAYSATIKQGLCFIVHGTANSSFRLLVQGVGSDASWPLLCIVNIHSDFFVISTK